MSIVKIDEALCNGCTICVEDCPMDVIRMNEDKGKAYIAYTEDCGTCYLCSDGCPVEAIQVSPLIARKQLPKS